MAFFSKYPQLLYTVTDAERAQIVTDVLRRVQFRTEYKDIATMFDVQLVADGERPEQFAYAFYEDPETHWIIMLVNDIIDPYRDWPMSEDQVIEFAKEKYGETNLDEPHHFEANGIIVTPGYPLVGVNLGADVVEISNIQYEIERNEKKRRMRVLRSDLVAEFTKQFEEKIK